MKRFSIVIPVYNELAGLPALREALARTLNERSDLEYEVIMVNDGSRDGTGDALNEFAAADPRFRVIHLSRNFGQQAALTAGLDFANGDYIGLVDADLQDPPELLIPMLKLVEEGWNVVYGQRTERRGESWFKIETARTFYRLLSVMTAVPIPLDTGDFRVVDRKVLNAIREMREYPRFLRGMFAWIGFRSRSFPYERHARTVGHTKYPFRRMWKFAIEAIFAFSDVPLALASYVGIGIVALGTLGFIGILLKAWILGQSIAGLWALLSLLVVLGGFQLLTLGIMGHYISQIFHQTKLRPLYLIQDSKNLQLNSPV